MLRVLLVIAIGVFIYVYPEAEQIIADLLRESGDDFLGSAGYGEGGIRTHEGVTPTRFRVVRDQPDSATSPHAIGRTQSLMADEPGTHSMLQKQSTLRFRRF